MRPRRWGKFAAAVLFVGAGCAGLTTETTTTDTTTTEGQPVLEIDPAEFLGGVVCADLPGAMRSYVATFIDLGPGAAGDPPADGYPVILPSSPPAPCSQRVSFTNGVSGHRYQVEIDGYEEAPSQIVPVCSQKPEYAACFGMGDAPLGAGVCNADTDCFALGCYGECISELRQVLTNGVCDFPKANGMTVRESINVCIYRQVAGDRHMVKPGTATIVSPRWQTPADYPCGLTQPAVGNGFTKVEVGDCAPLVDSSTSNTGIRITLGASALGDLSCKVSVPDAGTMGTVTSYDVIPFDPALDPVLGTACTAKNGPLFTTGVVPGTEYGFRIDAYEDAPADGGPPPKRSATCFAVALEGVIVPAKCDPLF